MVINGITDNHKKEALSRAYINFVAAKAGASVSMSNFDYGIDVSFNEVQKYKGDILEAGATFKCQLKSTQRWKLYDKYVTYKMKSKDYNRLVKINNCSTLPCVLILLCLPTNVDEWHEICEEYLKIRRCCYWLHWKNEIEIDNSSSISIQFPRDQLFTPDALASLFRSFGKGER